jgi:hypothetical protein
LARKGANILQMFEPAVAKAVNEKDKVKRPLGIFEMNSRTSLSVLQTQNMSLQTSKSTLHITILIKPPLIDLCLKLNYLS